MNLKRVGAIFIKELQDIRTNWNQLFMYIMPIGFAFIYCKLIPQDQLSKGTGLILGLSSLVTMAGILIPAMMIAEEKEKRTLEVLLLSPAKPGEIFLGKSLTTFILMIICMFIMLLIDNQNWGNLPIILVSTAAVSAFCILFGLIAGIFSKNQMSTGIVSMPLVFLLLMLPMFAIIGINQLKTVASAMPTYHYLELLKKAIADGKGFADSILEFGVLIGGIIIATSILLVVCRKKGLES